MLADRYELDREIGRGGMGSVWLGHDTVLDRTVALKKIGLGHGDGDGIDLGRAEREAHLTARINHQHVVAVFDLVDDSGDQWLVMEYVDGPSLAAIIADRGRIEESALTSIVTQIAGALAAAHAHGIVHRDVKPSNILLTSDGTAKLADFGVARAQADAALTRTGIVTGSPAYVSPEVVSGRTAGPASDVWSLGATIHHALAGRPPYEIGDNLLGAMFQIVNEDPPLLEGDTPLTRLVATMMQRDPDVRPSMAQIEQTLTNGATAEIDLGATQGFAAFAEVSEAPTAVAAPTAVSSPTEVASPTEVSSPTPPAHRSRTVWIAAAAAAAVLGAVLVAGLGDDDTPADAPVAAGASESPTPDEPASPDGDTPVSPADDTVTAGALEGFAADYLTTASNDPDAGFALLTPAYQRESDGIDGYKGFWDKVSDLDVEQVAANPEALTVSYTYSYDFDGDRRTEAVTLSLEDTADGLRIAGAV